MGSVSFLTDTFSRGGAEWLAKRIAGYWGCQGYRVDVRVEKSETLTGEVYVVRSDMLDGWPRGRL